MKPCLLIPIYDHGREIPGVLEALAVHGLPCLVIDDGSAAPTRNALETLAAKHPWVEVHRRERNGGRGAALKTGYRLAQRRGFSHAIQLDADGQHDPADVPRFLAAAAKDPEALLLGAPVFDASIPKSRLYGRQLSRGMVWGLTGSFQVEDPLCGFRGIPLAATVALLDATPTGDHMEFDPEFVIAHVWRGTVVRNLPTRVVYDPMGLSHFDMLRDNARLSWVYTRAAFALPLRVARRRRGPDRLPVSPEFRGSPPAAPEPGGPATGGRWAQIDEVGTAQSLRIVFGMARYVPRPVALALVSVIAAYYTLTNSEARRSSRAYLERMWALPEGRAALGRAPSLSTVFRHIREFAVALYDRMTVWGGVLEDLNADHDGSEEVFEMERAGQGALVLGSHLGSADMLWSISRRHDLRVNVVAFFGNAQRINAFLESLDPEMHVRVIEIDPDSVRAAFEIRACLARGEFVVILADRVPPKRAARVAETTFLGAPARFPLSPFRLAGALGCPTYFALCVRTGDARYKTVLRHIGDGRPVPRQDREKRARELLERYTGHLEAWCLRFPLQWFNFFDFWELDENP